MRICRRQASVSSTKNSTAGDGNLLKIKEAIVVEGNYDKIKLSSLVDTLIITTGGFRVFKDRQKIEFIRSIARKTGIIILTDSDGAGFIIRNYVKQGIDKQNIKHAYIPDIFGKEKRKSSPSKEGKLGVEGVEGKVIISALINAGATVLNAPDMQLPDKNRRRITKLDLYNSGLTGGAQSAQKRKRLQKHLGLPEHMSANMLADTLNIIMNYEQYSDIVAKLDFTVESKTDK